NKKIKVKRLEKCTVCEGKGGSGVKVCDTCKGQGQVRQVSRSLFGQIVNVAACPDCGGTGKTISNPCSACSGDGRKRVDATLSVNIPAGVSEGNYIPLEGQGDAGPQGGPAGDVIVIIQEKEHERFERHGIDLLGRINITIGQAVLGDEIILETLKGKIKLTIPPGTQSGKRFRVKGKGLPDVHYARTGDLYIDVRVQTPVSLKKEEKELFKRLREIEKSKGQDKSFFSRIFR
ncbi:MAG: DnaJ C-terminal domain-containing protein, partial [Fibrobacterota bacterium]